MISIKTLIKGIILVILLQINTNIVLGYDFRNDENRKKEVAFERKIIESNLYPIITESQEVIGEYYFGGTKRNIFSLPKWKYKLMDEAGLTDSQKLHYHIINSLECGKEDGSCVGPDIGPFQINKAVHSKSYNASLSFIENNDHEGLYTYQVNWTFDRLEHYKDNLCQRRWKTEDEIFGCMLRVHNGNNKEIGDGMMFKELYAIKGLEIKKFLLSKMYMQVARVD